MAGARGLRAPCGALDQWDRRFSVLTTHLVACSKCLILSFGFARGRLGLGTRIVNKIPTGLQCR